MKKTNLKDKLSNLGKYILDLGLESLNLIKDLAKIALVLGIISIGVLKLPELHNKYLRHAVGSKVYMIKNTMDGRGGGTGFAIKGPSGASYILTNDHVCGVSEDGETVAVVNDEGNGMRRRIIAHDDYSDLCLIEGLPGVQGIDVAIFEPSLGDTLYAIGHPLLMPLHVSAGEMTGYEDVQIILGPISIVNPYNGSEEQIDPARGGILAEDCEKPKNYQVLQDLDFGFFAIRVKFCGMEIKGAYVTGAVIHPGNSGSPVVNFWGNLQGVAFASNRTNFGYMVSLTDINNFLENY